MAEEHGEKTEEATEHKLQEARKRGQVFKSREVVSALEFATMALVLVFSGAAMARTLLGFTYRMFSYAAGFPFDGSHVWAIFVQAVIVFAKMVIPILSVAFITVVLFNLLQVGFVFTAAPFTPSWSKISPIEGFKRMFSRKSVVELFKQMVKILIIGMVSYEIVKGSVSVLAGIAVWPVVLSTIYAKNLTLRIFGFVAAFYLVLGVIDYLIQKKFFLKEMKMSIQELKDELKETEGDPHVKQRMRMLQRQLVQRSMLRRVPQATAVITNPVHLAVALQYEFGKMEAPVVVAKGERLMAQQIKEIAEEHEIAVIENVGLARALYEACEVGEFIPGDLYKAVAEVLAFVYRLKKKRELAKIRSILRIRQAGRSRATAAGR